MARELRRAAIVYYATLLARHDIFCLRRRVFSLR